MKNKRILIAISNLTNFYAIENDIVELQKKAMVDIVVINSYGEDFQKSIEAKISECGMKTKSLADVSKISYQVLLEPYPITNGITTQFRIRYEYGVTPAYNKPDPAYTPEWHLPYDASVCYSPIVQDILSAYTKPYIIRPTQFKQFKLHKKGKRTNVLVLFTWGDVRATKELARIKRQLGEDYNIIVKAHHGIEYLSEHKDDQAELMSIADEYYDAATNVNRLFEVADIVLTDNSSAVFTAIYLGIPAAIYSQAKSDYFNLNGIKAGHFALLIEPKRIPYTNKVEEVGKIIKQAPRNIGSQNKLKDELYPRDVQETLADVVEKYLRINRKQEPYYIIRDLLLERKRATEATVSEQANQIDALKSANDMLKSNSDELNRQLESLKGIKRSARLLSGNIGRRIKKIIK